MAREPFSLNNLPDWMRGRFDDGQRFLLLCICAGVLCGLVGVSFHLAITTLFNGLFGFYQGLGVWAIPAMILSPALAGLLVGLMIRYVSPTAAGSGIPQTKAAYHHHFGVIKTTEAFWRFIIGTISVAFGNSLGREGPTVHICSALSAKLGRLFGLGKLRVQAMVPVGMGAGISAAFNAPLAAITFVFEELFDNNFSSKALGGILIAVVVAAVVERSILGEHSAFHATREAFETSTWMLVCLLLGPIAGLLGHAFTSLLLALRGRFMQWRRYPGWAKPALGGLSVGLIGVTVWQFSGGHHGVFSIGYADLNAALNGALIWQVLLLLFIGKFFATAICYALLLQDGISLKKLPAYQGQQDWRNLPVSTIMTHDCRTAIGSLNAKENLEAIKGGEHKHHGYPVIESTLSPALIGMVTHHELEEFMAAGKEAPLGELLTGQRIVAIHPDASIRDTANTLVLKDVLQAPVVSRKDATRLLGIVTLHDIARQQNAIEEVMERD